MEYQLPPTDYCDNWEVVIDTSRYDQGANKNAYKAGEKVQAEGRSVIVLQHQLIRDDKIKKN